MGYTKSLAQFAAWISASSVKICLSRSPICSWSSVGEIPSCTTELAVIRLVISSMVILRPLRRSRASANFIIATFPFEGRVFSGVFTSFGVCMAAILLH
ncbi:hypothetical protein AX774_g1308, partial [Zancudomyces culisetae]